MENKKLNKKLSSLFWYTLYALPLIFLLIVFIGNLLIFKDTGVMPEINIISKSFNDVYTTFNGFVLPFISNSFVSVFELLGFTLTSDLALLMVVIFTWFVQLMLLHVIVDVLTFIFNLFHKLMERVL